MATKTPTPKTSANLKATPAKASTSVSLKPKVPYNVVSIKEQLAAQVAANANRTAPPTGSKIRCTQDKQFIMPDGTKTAGPIDVIVLAFCTTHDFYEGAFDRNNIQPPICFAIGPDPKAMVPSSHSPVVQSDNCQSCPQNQFGSAANGKAKACKNGRSLALLPASHDGADVDHEADIWTLDVSSTALKGWDGYVQSLARSFGQPPVAFITEVSFNDAVTYPSLVFGNPRPITSLGEAMARQAEAEEMLAVEPDVSGYAVKKAAQAAAPTRAPARTPARRPAPAHS